MNSKTNEDSLKQEVSKFYNQIGWQMQDDGFYQNARYEDLRPVSHEYIHRCHMRVNRYLRRSGKYLLDAGSGPVQYPEYLSYSEKYRYRVCLDISIKALQEARVRLQDKGLYVVADVANLPFKSDTFDGIVSLHTLHHIPPEQHAQAYQGFVRVLTPGSTGVVVNAWTSPKLMARWSWMIRGMDHVNGLLRKLSGRREVELKAKTEPTAKKAQPTGTYTQHITPEWLKEQLTGKVKFDIFVWRSASVRFLRSVIQPWFAGKLWLRLLYRNEEKNPRYFGENGQYPLIVIYK
ncbi:MAG: class I SAM-dependent methyltransferase [Anaerolineaceae bacterium]|jgi:SAM-dependent methyltransferase|nr:class I SAM-dependent methyltransferase [Anaerolineaceae bacterium]